MTMAFRVVGDYYWVQVPASEFSESYWTPAQCGLGLHRWKLIIRAGKDGSISELRDEDLTVIGDRIPPPDQLVESSLLHWIYNKDTLSWQIGLLVKSNWVVADHTPDVSADGTLDGGLVFVGPQIDKSEG
jgi:hypothetical protein